MKRRILFVISMLLNIVGNTLADNLSVSDIQLSAGEEKQISINLTNIDHQYVAFQFDLHLPDGLTVSKDNKGRLLASLNKDRVIDHTFTISEVSPSTYRLLAYSGTNAEFDGSSGTLVNVTIKADESFKNGEFEAIINSAKFTESNGVKYTLSDVSFKIRNPAPQPNLTIIVKDVTRLYGDENPQFEYTVIGGALEGEPELRCEATKTSKAGQYEIVISRGSIEYEDISFVNGTLTVEKAPLTIKADDKQMTQGDPLPVFTASYNGFKNGENESVLSKKPEFLCSASSASEMGSFDIVPSNAEAENYEITYQKGTLNIIPKPRPDQEDKLIVDDVEMEGKGEKQIAIHLSNHNRQYVAFQFDLLLPDGMTVSKDDKGRFIASLNEERTNDHTFTISEVSANTYRLLAYSGSNAEFYGTSGPLVNVTIKADDSLKAGKYEAKTATTKFTINNGTKYSFDDVYFDIKITGLDDDFITISLSDDWQLFCSNKDLFFNEDENLKAYIASGIDLKQGFVNMTHIYDVPAGTGVLLIGRSGQSYQVPINKTAYIYSNYLKGVLEDTSIRTGLILDGKKFVPISDTQMITAGSAYLNVKASVSELDVNFVEGVHSDISPIHSQASSPNTTWFSLQGTRLTGVPQHHGVYINKGYKVYVK